MNLSKNAILAIVSLLLFDTAMVLAFYGLDLRYKAVKEFKQTGLSFDSRSLSREESSIKEITETFDSRQKEIEIRFRMKVHSIGAFHNILQTADLNSGIRLELSKPATLAIVFGAEKAEGEFLTRSLNLGRWYSVVIKIDKARHLEVFLDDVRVVDRLLGSIDYRISDLAIGAGFSKTRPFDGEIRDFSVEYRFLERRERGFLNTFYAIFLASCVLLLFALFPIIRAFLVMLMRGSARYVKALLHAWSRFKEGSNRLYAWMWLRAGSSRLHAWLRLKAGGNRLHTWSRPERARNGLDRDTKIRLSTTIVMVGFALALIFHYSKGAFYGTHAPFFSSFLHYPVNIFCDFYAYFDYWARMGMGAPITYFPGALVILDFFFHIGMGNPYIAVIPYLGIFILFVFAYVYSNVSSADRLQSFQTAFVLTFLSYPMLFTIHTGNMESFVFMSTALFFYFYQRGRLGLSSIFLGLAISMKLMPAVFIVLLLADKRYKAITYTALGVVFFTILPFIIFKGDVLTLVDKSIQGFKGGSQLYLDMMIRGYVGTYFGHSLLNGARAILGPSFAIEPVLAPYFVFAIIAFGLIAIYIIVLEVAFWKKATLCVVALDLLPYTSTDYKLLYLFIPLFLFINSDKSEKLDLLYVILFALLLIPKDYYHFAHGGPFVNLNVVLNPVLMLSIAILIVAPKVKNLASGIIRRPC